MTSFVFLCLRVVVVVYGEGGEMCPRGRELGGVEGMLGVVLGGG